MRDKNPKLFQHCLSLFRKDRVRDHFDLSAPQPVVHITRHVAPERGCLSLIWPLAKHPTSNNEIIVWDLAEDPAQLLTLSAEEIRARVFVKTDELPEGVTRLPLRTIKVNCAPVVISNLKKIRDEVLAQWSFDIDLHMTHAARAGELQKELRDPYRWQAVFARQNVPCDVDEDLYGAFLSNRDRSMLEDLRRLPPEQMALAGYAFQDPRLEELVFRYRARNFPATLSQAEQERRKIYVSGRHNSSLAGTRTVKWLNAELERLQLSADEVKARLLQGVQTYVNSILKCSA